MIEVTTATYIADNSVFTVEEDIFLNDLFEDGSEGICFLLLNDIDRFGLMKYATIQILLYYRDYVVSRNYLKIITDLLDAYRGTSDGSWCVLNDIESKYLGICPKKRHITEIIFEVTYDKTMI